MDQENITVDNNSEQTILSGVPDEVIEFAQSKAFTVLIDGIQEVLKLTQDQKNILRSTAYKILFGLKSEGEGYEILIESGLTPETAVSAIFLIATEIVGRASEILESNVQLEDILETDPINTEDAPSPNDVLNMLADRLAKTQVATPTARTYTEGSRTQDIKKADPYREHPEI